MASKYITPSSGFDESQIRLPASFAHPEDVALGPAVRGRNRVNLPDQPLRTRTKFIPEITDDVEGELPLMRTRRTGQTHLQAAHRIGVGNGALHFSDDGG